MATKSKTMLRGIGADLASKRFASRLATVLAMTVRILLDDRAIKVTLVNEHNGFVADSNPVKKSIRINWGQMESLFQQNPLMAIGSSKGLLYHEAAHLMWTPSRTAFETIFVYTRHANLGRGQYHAMFNMIEDKRIENLFVRLYSPSAPYFGRPMIQHFLPMFSKEPTATWMNVVGRPWIGKSNYLNMRAVAENRLGKTMMAEIDSVVQRYLTLSASDFESDPRRVAEILDEWIDLLYRVTPTQPPTGGCGGTSQRIDNADTFDDSLSDEEAAEATPQPPTPTSNSDKEEEPADDANDDSSQGSAKDNQSEDDSDSGDADSSNAEGVPGDGEDGESESDGGGEAEPTADDETSESGDGSGTDPRQGDQQAPDIDSIVDDLMDTFDELSENIASDSEATLESTLDGIEQADAESPSSVKPIWITDDRPVDQEMRVTSRRIQQELERITNQATSERIYGSDIGRLNVLRDLLYEDTERLDVFDLWDEGTEDEMSVKVTIAMDQSASMREGPNGRPYELAAKALWILQNAFERADHSVSIYGYGTTYQRLDERHSASTYPVRRPEGGTYPLDMLRDAITASLATKDCSNHLLVVVTDGSWGRVRDAATDLVESFNQQGGVSTLFLLESDESAIIRNLMTTGHISDTHPYGFGSYHEVRNPLEMIEPTKNLVEQLMQSHLRRR